MQLVNIPAELGAAIRERRRKLGYTLAEVAEANGCSIRLISELERGKPGVGIGRIIQIAGSVGLDIAVIERGDGQWC